MKKTNLREKILYCLKRYEKCRNDDTYLTLKIIQSYFPDEMLFQNEKYWFSQWALTHIREDHVKRIRATIQNDEHRYLPTDPVARKKRKISEEEWGKYLGYGSQLFTA